MSQAFNDLLKQVGQSKLPPVENWHPDRIGEIDIRIKANGEWLHEGVVIHRKPIVKIFASILRIEEDGYFLVTPVEKLAIQVEDVPFVVVDMESLGEGREQSVVFKSNVDDVILLDCEHPLTLVEDADGFKPYVHVRNSLQARLVNEVFYRLADLVEDEEAEPLYLWSGGKRFRVS